MKIGIYKPSFVTRFDEGDDSSILINPEIVNLVKILSSKHDVRMMSSFIQGINKFPKSGINDNNFNIKILINGKLYIKNLSDKKEVQQINHELSEIKKIFNNKVPQYHFITDLKIKERNGDVLNGIDFKEVSQSKKVGMYGELEKLFLYNNPPRFNTHLKDKGLIYIGNQRGDQRTDLVVEYLINQSIPTEIYGNWDDDSVVAKSKEYLGILTFNQTTNILSHAKYGLCISDYNYRDNNFVTPRYYEYITQGVIAFADESYDKDNLLYKKNDFRIVKNRNELNDKINYLEKNDSFYKRLLQQQRREITPQMIVGKYQLEKLEEVLNL